LTYKTYSNMHIILYNTMSRCPVKLHLNLWLSDKIPSVNTVPRQLTAWTGFNVHAKGYF